MTTMRPARVPAGHERHALLDECPVCESGLELYIVVDGAYANFLCESCGHCWHVDLGRVSRVDPISCSPCPHRDRCLARLAEDEAAAVTSGHRLGAN